MKKLSITVCLLIVAINIMAQETVPTSNEETLKNAHSNFVLAGFGYAGYTKMDKEISNFGPTGFNPIFLWKKSEKLFFESELMIELTDGTTKFGLEYATMHYKLCNYLEISAGKFLSPFGIFNERIHPSWVNKFADNPLGFNHDVGTLVGPMSEIGVALAGGAQLGKSKINYAVYASNGPNLIADPNNPMMSGMLMYENVKDNNDNKAIGGRIGFLPLSNSSLEIGLSAQVAKVGDKNSVLYENIGTQMAAIDLSYYHKLNCIKSNIDIKAQFNMVNVDKAVKYPIDSTMTGVDSTFDNKSNAFFLQVGIRPTYVNHKCLKNLELAVRYSTMTLPEKAIWGGEFNQITIGINYWLSWHSVIKFDYQINNQKGMDSKTGFLVQWAIGF